MSIYPETSRETYDRSAEPPESGSAVVARVLDRDRLLALQRSGLLDTREEEAFDRLTRRACARTGAPTALVSLVDADRQFFKSARGLTGPAASARQTPLSHSFCQYVVAGERPLVVRDARRVPVLAGNPGITELAMVAYAGVPLSAHGHVLGAVCVIDALPHDWSAEDVMVLEDLACACGDEIHIRAALREGFHGLAAHGYPKRGDIRHRFDEGAAASALKPDGRRPVRARGDQRHAQRRWRRPDPSIPTGAEL